MSTATKVVFIIGILLLIYGYLCRLLSIYFFWDSKYFGWLGVFSGLLLVLVDIRMTRIRQRRSIFFIRVFVALIVISLAIEAGAIVLLKSSGTYNELKEAIRKEEPLKNEIGDVLGFGLIPGMDLIDIISAVNSGSLTFVITVRGEKAYRDLEINTDNAFGTAWRVTSVQPVSH